MLVVAIKIFVISIHLRSLMHNGIYPIKYLNESFLPNKSFLDNTILLISTLSILIGALFLWNAFLLIHCSSNIKAFSSIFMPCKEKKIKFFYVDFFALRHWFLCSFSLYLFSSDIFWYLFLLYSLLVFFSSSDNSLYLFLVCFCNLYLLFS